MDGFIIVYWVHRYDAKYLKDGHHYRKYHQNTKKYNP